MKTILMFLHCRNAECVADVDATCCSVASGGNGVAGHGGVWHAGDRAATVDAENIYFNFFLLVVTLLVMVLQ